jgi:FkbM family methyltransferase
MMHADDIALYGAGGKGRDLLRFFRGRGTSVRYFLDRNARPGQTIDGVPVYPMNGKTVDKSLPVVIAIFNPYVPVREVMRDLSSNGFEQYVPYVDVHAKYWAELGDDYWLTARSFIQTNYSRIETAANCFSDDISRRTFRDAIAFRETGDFNAEPQPQIVQHYFPADVPNWKTPQSLRFIDCGAYTGDTIKAMLEMDLNLENVAAFEPDAQSFAGLNNVLKSVSDSITAVALPCGVSDKNGLSGFVAGGGEGSRLSSSGEQTIQCVALDDTVYGMRPNLIKMDVEGAELLGLRGAQRIMRDFRPRLAISVYHLPDHLWEIPLFIAALGLDYQLYLRSHGYQTFDTVLYAIPQPFQGA